MGGGVFCLVWPRLVKTGNTNAVVQFKYYIKTALCYISGLRMLVE